jgi:hypothetical protein
MTPGPRRADPAARLFQARPGLPQMFAVLRLSRATTVNLWLRGQAWLDEKLPGQRACSLSAERPLGSVRSAAVG